MRRVIVYGIGFCLLAQSALLTAAYPQNPLLADDSIYLSQQGVYRFDPARERPLWSSLVGVETYAPVAAGDQLLVGSTQGLYALDRASGRINWHIEARRSIFSPSVATRAYAGSLHGELYAIELGSGEINWRRQFPGWIYSPAIEVEAQRLWSGGQMHAVVSLATRDGVTLDRIATTQESVFSPLDLGDGRAAFNLFDGSTLVIDMRTAKTLGILAGQSQPTGLKLDGNSLYRSHRDGSLAVFSRSLLTPRWRRQFTPQDLSLHPARAGFLLLGDQDRNLILFDIAAERIRCRLDPRGRWMLPVQLESGQILHFQKNLQPPMVTLVKPQATCN